MGGPSGSDQPAREAPGAPYRLALDSARRVPNHRAARATVESRLAQPGWLVEIAVIAAASVSSHPPRERRAARPSGRAASTYAARKYLGGPREPREHPTEALRADRANHARPRILAAWRLLDGRVTAGARPRRHSLLRRSRLPARSARSGGSAGLRHSFGAHFRIRPGDPLVGRDDPLAHATVDDASFQHMETMPQAGPAVRPTVGRPRPFENPMFNHGLPTRHLSPRPIPPATTEPPLSKADPFRSPERCPPREP